MVLYIYTYISLPISIDFLDISVGYLLHCVEPSLKQKAKARNLFLSGVALALISLNLKKMKLALD
jgi:hypothetical protein